MAQFQRWITPCGGEGREAVTEPNIRGKLTIQSIRAQLEMDLIRNYRNLFTRLFDRNYSRAHQAWADAENELYSLQEKEGKP